MTGSHMREAADGNRGMRTLGALCLAVLLAGFVPPQRQPESDRSQLVQPKSWIPDSKPNMDPPITALVDPPNDKQEQQPSPFAPGFTPKASACTLEKGEFSPEFKTAVDAALAEHSAGELDRALASVDTASSLATSDLQRYLVDMLRGQIFKSMRNREGYEAALRSMIVRDCFLVPGEKEMWQQYLDELTGNTDL